MVRTVVSAILAVAPALTGCATGINCLNAKQVGPREDQIDGLIYGGVLLDFQGMQALVRRVKHLDPDDSAPVRRMTFYALNACLLTLDVPLCLVADTLTLPLTISHTLQCQALAREQDREAQQASPHGRFLTHPGEANSPTNPSVEK